MARRGWGCCDIPKEDIPPQTLFRHGKEENGKWTEAFLPENRIKAESRSIPHPLNQLDLITGLVLLCVFHSFMINGEFLLSISWPWPTVAYQVCVCLWWAGDSHWTTSSHVALHVVFQGLRSMGSMATRRVDHEGYSAWCSPSRRPFPPAHPGRQVPAPFNKYILSKVRWNFGIEFWRRECEWKWLAIWG